MDHHEIDDLPRLSDELDCLIESTGKEIWGPVLNLTEERQHAVTTFILRKANRLIDLLEDWEESAVGDLTDTELAEWNQCKKQYREEYSTAKRNLNEELTKTFGDSPDPWAMDRMRKLIDVHTIMTSTRTLIYTLVKKGFSAALEIFIAEASMIVHPPVIEEHPMGTSWNGIDN